MHSFTVDLRCNTRCKLGRPSFVPPSLNYAVFPLFVSFDEVAIRGSNQLWPHTRYSTPCHSYPFFLPTSYFPLHFDFFPHPLHLPVSISISPGRLPPSFYSSRSLSPLSSLLYPFSLVPSLSTLSHAFSLIATLRSSLSRFFVARSEPEVVWPGGGRFGFNYPILNCP